MAVRMWLGISFVFSFLFSFPQSDASMIKDLRQTNKTLKLRKTDCVRWSDKSENSIGPTGRVYQGSKMTRNVCHSRNPKAIQFWHRESD